MNLFSATESSIATEPGETQPFLTASTSHCSALYPAELGSEKTGLFWLSNSCPPIASVNRYQGVTPPSVAAIGIASGYWTPELFSFWTSAARSSKVAGNVVIPALANIFLLYMDTRKSFE